MSYIVGVRHSVGGDVIKVLVPDYISHKDEESLRGYIEDTIGDELVFDWRIVSISEERKEIT
jgi:hypothetical protein